MGSFVIFSGQAENYLSHSGQNVMFSIIIFKTLRNKSGVLMTLHSAYLVFSRVQWISCLKLQQESYDRFTGQGPNRFFHCELFQ